MRDEYNINELNPRNNPYTAKIAQRFAEIDAREPDPLSPEEAASLSLAESMDDGSSVSLDEFKASLGEELAK